MSRSGNGDGGNGDLSDALKRLEAEVARPLAAPEPERPPLTLRSQAARGEDGRIARVIVTRSDGRAWLRTPVRDADHRIVEVVTEELPSDGVSYRVVHYPVAQDAGVPDDLLSEQNAPLTPEELARLEERAG